MRLSLQILPQVFETHGHLLLHLRHIVAMPILKPVDIRLVPLCGLRVRVPVPEETCREKECGPAGIRESF